jgi:chaperone LolA
MTRLRSIFVALATVAALALSPRLVAGDDAQDLLGRVQDRYRSVKDATVSFTQHVLFGVTRSESSFKGSFVMKKGNKYRLELEDQTVVTDGKSLWSYSKANNQVIINVYREDPKSFSPDKVLVNVPDNYVAAIVGTETVRTRPSTILKLTPKTRRGSVRWMKIWVDDDGELMRRIQVFDASENTITYDLDEVTLNTGVPDARFEFTPPPKAEVIDLR